MHASPHLPLDAGLSKILYVLCKVRGEKVISGFLNNEPRYLELVLSALERNVQHATSKGYSWQVSYILLTWLSHLLLAPFDLATVAIGELPRLPLASFSVPSGLPTIALRITSLSLTCLQSASKEQEAAAKVMVRLARRPDMQQYCVATNTVSWASRSLSSTLEDPGVDLNACIGQLRVLAAMVVSPDAEELFSLIPSIYRTAIDIHEYLQSHPQHSSAIVLKILVKILRNIAILSLQPVNGTLESFFRVNGVLEEVIDILLQLLGDKDTQVRFASSKALGMIVTKLEPELGHEIIQAVLDGFQENITASTSRKRLDVSMVNASRWHGLTMTLAHGLFRRSAAPSQLPEIIDALLIALSFEQRAVTGQSIGSNVRDAACFGLWSLARRYTTVELLAVDVTKLPADQGEERTSSVIQLSLIHI